MATSFGRAAGIPDYGPTGTSRFNPVIWSKTLVKRWYPATVLTHISNTNFEGEIKGMGSQVQIRTEGDVPVYLNEYQKGGTLKPPDRIESPAITLDIDQNTHFYFGIDSIDKYQSDIPLMTQWADGAVKNEKIKIDTDVLAYFVGTTPYSATLASSYNYGATAGAKYGAYNIGVSGAPYQATTANVIKLLAMCEAILGEQDVPDDEDWFFVMPRVLAMLLKTSDIKDASMMGDGTSALRSGRLGRLLNFTLFASNLLPSATDGTTGQRCFYPLFGHKYGLTFASQFVETNYIDNPETTFGKFIKSLHVFGRKVIKPSAIGFAYVAPLLTD